MKLTLTLVGLASLANVTLGAIIANNDVSADVTVKDSYIVTYKKGVSAEKKRKHVAVVNKKAKGSGKKGVSEIEAIDGYVVEIPASDISTILNSPDIESVEKDTVVNITSVIPEVDEYAVQKRTYTTQAIAQWGLGRISHKGANTGWPDYYYDTTAGVGVRVYVLDTGIRISHAEFGGRAVWGKNFIVGSPNTDEKGHGTHVAGTIAGKTYGVAKRATVVAVKVLDKNGSGTFAGVIEGINWIVKDAKARGIARKAVINASLGGGYTAAVNAAVKAATDAGITCVVSAGNSGDDSKWYSPASTPSAITVAAIDGTDARAWFSNYGTLVDIFAPGVDIQSAWHLSNTAVRWLSGTSMASPHVAGLAAYFISKEGLLGSTAVTNRIIAASVKNEVIDPVGSYNRIAYNAGGR